MSRLGRAVMAAAVALLLAACVPVSNQPLSDPATARLTPELAGVWTARIENEQAGLHILFRDERLAELLLTAERRGNEGPRGEWMAFTFFPSRIGGHDYVNLRYVTQSGANQAEPPEGYLFAHYRLSPDGSLDVWTMSAGGAKQAIQSGLAGEIKKGKWVDEVRFAATTAELAAYLASHDPKTLFAEHMGTFRRLK
ncbi:MAG: hypothetical protein QF893_13695 [Alphaproteobacteria bacterium]|jgi:hypothetical protein|nr:hypothetical protein [Alphaproteobacteria bacterium]